jgi:hypothetical protein
MTLRLNGSTSGFTEIDAPAVAGSNTLTLPGGNGTNGQVLTTDGAGALSFTTVAGAGSLADGSAAAPSVAFASDVNTGIFRAGNDLLAFSTGGTQRAQFDASGRLLVGTSTISVFDNHPSATVPITTTEDALRANYAAISHSSVSASAGGLLLGRSRSGSVGGRTIVQSGDSLGRLSFQGADGGTEFVEAAEIRAEVDGTPGANSMPGRIVLSTTASGAGTPTERMRINSSGFTKYSNTGSYLNTAGSYHEFNSNQNNVNLLIRCTDTGGGVEAIETQLASGTSSAAYQLRHYLGASQVAYLTSGGDWRIAAGKTYGNISDERKKTNIVDATSKLEDIKKLRVRNFEPINEPGNKCIGFIAQEFEQVFPGLVTEREDEELVSTPVLDDDGNETGEYTTERVKTGESIKSIKETALISILVKSLQEAVAKIETLEARLTALEVTP